MLKIRTTKISSGNTAIQVVNNADHKTYIIKHIGTGKTTQEIEDLKKIGSRYIDNLRTSSGEISFLKEENPLMFLEDVLSNLNIKESFHTFAHEYLKNIYDINVIYWEIIYLGI